ncbi:MAG: FAD-dependent monooxygenase [Deltaproteobacteria bacterium]|nr:FAD-dependent monooxygenase [Deltaproteobacteria bacterium]
MHDVVIVGAGVAGAALGAALGGAGRRVLLVERDLRDPKLFVGELLQPGGVGSLERLGLAGCLEGIDAQQVRGFAVVQGESGQALPYPRLRGQGSTRPAARGFAFHHGRFVGRLRRAARETPGVELCEGTVTGLLEEAGRVVGVRYRDRAGAEHAARANLVCAVDGRHSRLRQELTGAEPVRASHAVGLLLQGVELPYPGHGTVFLTEPSPMLSYQIGPTDVRVLADVPGELPAVRTGALAEWLRSRIAPQLPRSLRPAFLEAVAGSTLKVMPNYFLAPKAPPRPGVVLLADALNLRHPLTGSGMTVALNDVRLLVEALEGVELTDRSALAARLKRFYRARRALSTTVDILSGALYQIFCGGEPGLDGMREAVLRYFRLGGPAVRGPMSLLSGLSPHPSRLLAHYGAVAMVGMGQSLRPEAGRGWPGAPELRDASALALAALRTIRPQLERALGA